MKLESEPLESKGPGPDDTPAHDAAEPPKLSRKRTFAYDADEVVTQIIEEYEQDLSDRQTWSEQRLQRYAKYRGWLEHKTQPWDGACFTLDTEILTDTGWKLVGEIVVGECVYTMDATGMATYAP